MPVRRTLMSTAESRLADGRRATHLTDTGLGGMIGVWTAVWRRKEADSSCVTRRRHHHAPHRQPISENRPVHLHTPLQFATCLWGWGWGCRLSDGLVWRVRHEKQVLEV